MHRAGQNPLQLGQGNLYLPDLVLARRDGDFYENRYPGPDDVLLAIEVADRSLYRDRTVKLPVYARAQVPRLWIVDLAHRCVHEYAGLTGGTYRGRRRCAGSTELGIPDDGGVTARELVD